MLQEAERLKSLSETHVVAKDAVESPFKQSDHPVESLELVVVHRAFQRLWLRLEPPFDGT